MQKDLYQQNAQNRLYYDIQQYYNRHIGYSDEELLSNRALLKIIANVFTGKTINKYLSRNKDLVSFNNENLKYIDDCIQKNDVSNDSILTIITNCIAIVHKEILTRPRKKNEKEFSKFEENHFDIPSVVNTIREYYGFRNMTFKQMEIEFIIRELLLIIINIFLLFACIAVFILAGWWRQNPPIIKQSGTNWFYNHFINPLSEWLYNSVLPMSNQNISGFVPFIIIAGIILSLLFICSIWINKKLWDRNRLQYQINYLCRKIGMSCEILQKEGWL